MKKLMIKFSTRRWFTLIIVFSFLFGGIAYAGFHMILSPLPLISVVVLFSIIPAFFLILLYVLDKQVYRLEQYITDTENELKAVSGIQRFTKLPLKLKDWAVSGEFLERLIREVFLRKPNLIIECGSGTSTVVMASCLKELGKGKIIALEHDKEYAKITRKLIEVEDLAEWVEVIDAPLKEISLNENKKYQWYDFEPDKYLSTPIDILIVDGPPGDLQYLSRYPAVPVLNNYFSKKICVMLDDTQREDEKRISKNWEDRFGFKAKRTNARFSFDVLEKENK